MSNELFTALVALGAGGRPAAPFLILAADPKYKREAREKAKAEMRRPWQIIYDYEILSERGESANV